MASDSQENEEAAFISRIVREHNLTLRPYGSLSDTEVYWRDHQPWLESRGYRLRARYQPNWEPSWLKGNTSVWDAEDALQPPRYYLLDAIRIQDNKPVMLKHVTPSNHPFEAEMAQYFSSPPLANDPRNHCSPVYEVLQDPDQEDSIIIVMPLLRRYNDPEFATVGDAVDFFGQVIEGLEFMHKHNIAHRDATGINIMYDPSPLFPEGYHPIDTGLSPDRKHPVKPLDRRTHPCTYYFVDFGLTKRYDSTEGEPQDRIVVGADRTAPEHADRDVNPNKTANPFLTDVYYLGNMIRTDFLETKLRLDFMNDLVLRMVTPNTTGNPQNLDGSETSGNGENLGSRLTASAVALEFSKIRANLRPSTLNARLASRSEWFVGRCFRDFWHWAVGVKVAMLSGGPRLD